MSRYGHHIPYVPFDPPPITGAQLHQRVLKADESAMGLDGWRRAELKALPLPIWSLRAQVISLCEAQGRWPAAQCSAFQAHPPKGESPVPLPLDTRPIRVYTHMHRDYIAIRYSQLREWQEVWIHPAAHGGRVEHEVLEPYLELQLDVAESRADGDEITIDYNLIVKLSHTQND